MALSVSNLNMMMKYKHKQDSSVLQIVETLKASPCEYLGYNVCNIRGFCGNSVSQPCGSVAFDNTCVVSDNLNLDSENYTLSIHCAGLSKFSLLLRPNGNLRLSMAGTGYAQCDRDSVQQLLLTERDYYVHIVEKMFPIDIVRDTDFNMLLFNGVYNIVHNLKNTESCAQQIKDTRTFPHVVAPDFSGVVRRKGTINLYLHQSKKCGVVHINKKSFHLLGFTKVQDIRIALGWLNKIVSEVPSACDQ